MSFTIITTGRSYRLEELAAIVTASNDLSLYCEATISGERVGFQIDRATLLAGLSGLLTEVDGTPQGATSEIDFVGGTNVTLGTAFVGGKLTLTINAVGGGSDFDLFVQNIAPAPPVSSEDALWIDTDDNGGTASHALLTSLGWTASGHTATNPNFIAGFDGTGDAIEVDLEAEITDNQRSFTKTQWLDVTALTPIADVFTPNLETTSGSYTADIGANSTFANPVVPSGYSTGKVLAWDVTCTFTGAGNWTIGFGNQYRADDGVDLAAIIAANSTTGDVIQLNFQYKNGIVRVQPFVDTVIP